MNHAECGEAKSHSERQTGPINGMSMAEQCRPVLLLVHQAHGSVIQLKTGNSSQIASRPSKKATRSLSMMSP